MKQRIIWLLALVISVLVISGCALISKQPQETTDERIKRLINALNAPKINLLPGGDGMVWGSFGLDYGSCKLYPFTPFVPSPLHVDYEAEHKRVVEALVRIGEPAVQPLIEAAKDDKFESSFIRQGAIEVLGKIGDPRAVPVIIEALNDFFSSHEAIEALGEIGDQRAVPALIWKLKNRYSCVNEAALAAESLGKIGDLRAVPALTEALDYNRWVAEGPYVRKAAAEALGKIGSEAKDALPKLKETAEKDQDESVRQATKETIEKIQKASRENAPNQ